MLLGYWHPRVNYSFMEPFVAEASGAMLAIRGFGWQEPKSTFWVHDRKNHRFPKLYIREKLCFYYSINTFFKKT